MGQNWEQPFMDRLVYREKLTPTEENFAVDLLEKYDKEQIEMDDFKDVTGFTAEKIEKDKKEIAGIKTATAAKEAHLKSKNAEAAIYHGINQYGWFGEQARAIHASEYDDWVNGTDIILEVPRPGKKLHPLRLGMDITRSQNTEESKKKMEKVYHKMIRGKDNIEYFKSALTKRNGKLKEVPSVVLAFKEGTWENLIRTFNSKKGVENHIAQIEALEVIIIELENQLAFLKNNIPDSQDKQDTIKEYLDIFEDVLTQREKSLKEKAPAKEIDRSYRKDDEQFFNLTHFRYRLGGI